MLCFVCTISEFVLDSQMATGTYLQQKKLQMPCSLSTEQEHAKHPKHKTRKRRGSSNFDDFGLESGLNSKIHILLHPSNYFFFKSFEVVEELGLGVDKFFVISAHLSAHGTCRHSPPSFNGGNL
mmetsp:Transcript_36158/g.66799  ORF Transcript_36158/g.66799 Transcript_36158/m.66799 type:complete len:124 (+) Transcript_36158:276-647(+)